MTLPNSLKDTTMFQNLSENDLAALTAVMQTRQLAAGEILFHQGDPGDELLVVQSGKLAIFTPVAGKPDTGQAIRFFGPGDVLGEMALIDRKPRSASARAEEDSTVLRLHGDDFRSLLAQHPDTAQAVMAGLSDRIRYTTDFLSEVRNWVQRMMEGNYQSAANTRIGQYRDPTLAMLAGEFARMATVVQEREELLKQEVMQLRVEIDQVKRIEDASRIMGSEYYQALKERAKTLRKQNK